jgi:hypothetical protein
VVVGEGGVDGPEQWRNRWERESLQGQPKGHDGVGILAKRAAVAML